MRKNTLFVVLGLAAILYLSLSSLRSNLAIGQAMDTTGVQAQILAKLDQIITNQDRLLSRINEVEQELSHQIKIFGKP